MKKNIKIFLINGLLGLGLILLFSCVSNDKNAKPDNTNTPNIQDEKNTPDNKSNTPNITAELTIDGKETLNFQQTESSPLAVMSPKDQETGLTALVLAFESKINGIEYSMTINSNIKGVGAYNFIPDHDPDQPHAVMVFAVKGNGYGMSGSGGGSLVLTITSLTDKRIQGTFSGEVFQIMGPGSIKVKNGKFDVGVLKM